MQMDGWIDIVDRYIDIWMDRFCRSMEGLIDGWIHGWLDGQIDIVDVWMD